MITSIKGCGKKVIHRVSLKPRLQSCHIIQANKPKITVTNVEFAVMNLVDILTITNHFHSKQDKSDLIMSAINAAKTFMDDYIKELGRIDIELRHLFKIGVASIS
ncbi:unnamed protein product [Lactuca virosa]|uniref:Uncharacterized protein n=1 Tax=Lactuca virosa TaxID=75947 RepID=A0AAU9MII4_9ASTR|nr:unnamed protein product [Lactuca virosa]